MLTSPLDALCVVIPDRVLQDLGSAAKAAFEEFPSSMLDMVATFCCSSIGRALCQCLHVAGITSMTSKLLADSTDASTTEVLLVARATTHIVQVLQLASFLVVSQSIG